MFVAPFIKSAQLSYLLEKKVQLFKTKLRYKIKYNITELPERFTQLRFRSANREKVRIRFG